MDDTTICDGCGCEIPRANANYAGPGDADRRFDVTEPTGRPESDANAPTHTNTHAGAETAHSARQVAPCGEVAA